VRSRRKIGHGRALRALVVLTGFLALMGLSYVYLTLQLYHLGDRKKHSKQGQFADAK
jgi:hypothetical protein